jgi:hypothetical protein
MARIRRIQPINPGAPAPLDAAAAPPRLPGFGSPLKLPERVAPKTIAKFPPMGRVLRDPNAIPLAGRPGPAPMVPMPAEPYPIAGPAGPDLSPIPLGSPPVEPVAAPRPGPGMFPSVTGDMRLGQIMDLEPAPGPNAYNTVRNTPRPQVTAPRPAPAPVSASDARIGKYTATAQPPGPGAYQAVASRPGASIPPANNADFRVGPMMEGTPPPAPGAYDAVRNASRGPAKPFLDRSAPAAPPPQPAGRAVPQAPPNAAGMVDSVAPPLAGDTIPAGRQIMPTGAQPNPSAGRDWRFPGQGPEPPRRVGDLAVRGSARPGPQPSRLGSAVRSFGPLLALEAGANPEGVAHAIGHPLEALGNMGGAIADGFAGLGDGRFAAGASRLMSGDRLAWKQAVERSPVFGQVIGAGENIGKGAAEWIKDPRAALAGFGAGVDRMGSAMFGPSAPDSPAPQAPDLNPNHLPPELLAQVQGAGGNPSNFTTMGGSLVSLPGVAPPPVPQAPQLQPGPGATADEMNRFFNSMGVGPGEKALAPLPTPQAPALPQTPAAPANNPVVAAGKPAMSADQRQMAVAQRTMHTLNRQMAGLQAQFDRYQNPEFRQQIAGQMAQIGDAIARQQQVATQLGNAPAERRLLGARADREESDNRSPGAKMDEIMKDAGTYEAFLVSKGVAPDQIPFMMERYRVNHGSRGAQGGGPAGPAPAGGQVDQQSYANVLRANPYMEGLRPLFDPTHAGFQANAGLPDILDRAMQYPGANDPNSSVAQVIREGIRGRFPGEALQGAVGDLGPLDDPTQAGWARIFGNSVAGRGLNSALGFVRDLNPWTQDNGGSSQWFTNYGRGVKYRNYLRGLGLNEIAPERGA